MKESNVESVASYRGPESCADVRKDGCEALTVVRAGRVLGREIHARHRKAWEVRGAEAVEICRRSHHACRFGETSAEPARSEAPRMRGNNSYGNREVPHPSAARWEAQPAERIVKPEGVRR